MEAYSHPTAPPAHHEEAAGNAVEGEDLPRIVNIGVVERDPSGQDGVRPGRDEDRPGPEHAFLSVDRARRGRCGGGPAFARPWIISMPCRAMLRSTAPVISGDDLGLARHQPLEGDLRIEREAEPVDLALAKAAHVQHGLAEGLGGDPAGAHGDTARRRRLLDDGHRLVVIRGLGRASSPAGPDPITTRSKSLISHSVSAGRSGAAGFHGMRCVGDREPISPGPAATCRGPGPGTSPGSPRHPGIFDSWICRPRPGAAPTSPRARGRKRSLAR